MAFIDVTLRMAFVPHLCQVDAHRLNRNREYPSICLDDTEVRLFKRRIKLVQIDVNIIGETE